MNSEPNNTDEKQLLSSAFQCIESAIWYFL